MIYRLNAITIKVLAKVCLFMFYFVFGKYRQADSNIYRERERK